MRTYFFIFAFLTLISNLNSQVFTINGNLISEKSDEVIIGAAVSLLSLPDSSIKGGAYTKLENGKNVFELKANKGKYLIKISHLAYKEKFLNIDIDKNLELKDIKLSSKDIGLEEIVVTGEKEYLELNLDKKVFNVSKDETNKGRNVSDILDNIPSVTVDAEGNVSLKGSEGVRILVDGKQSGLVGNDPEALRMLSGDLVDKIEVITNPSAKYDAAGQVGIINIVLKKEERKGLNGNSTLKTGYPDNHGLTVSSNYRTSNINLFSSVGISYNNFPGSANVSQYFYNLPEDEKYLTKSDRTQTTGGTKGTIRFGSDFFLNDQNTLTLTGMYSYTDRNNIFNLTYNDYNRNDVLLSKSLRTDNENEGSENIEFSANYSLKFNNEGHELTANTNFFQDDELEQSNLIQTYSNATNNSLYQKSSNIQFERNQLYQIDYKYPFSKDGNFETGLKSTLRKINNDYWLKNRDDNGNYIVDEKYDNNFIYHEDVYAVYMMANNKFNNFAWQLGLRGELSSINTELVKTNFSNPREYFNLFPSVHLSYKLNELNSVQVGYSRRLDRPRFWFLMPVLGFSDNRNFFKGNPNLNPEYSNSFDLGYLLNWKDGSILTNLYYRNSTNIIQRVTYIDDKGVTNITPENIGTSDNTGVEFNINYNAFQWWNFNLNLNSYNTQIYGNSSVGSLNANSWVTNFKVSSKFKLPYNVNFSTNYSFRGPMNLPQGKLLSNWFIDFALSKDITNDLTLTFNSSDVFSTRMRRMVTKDVSYYFNQDFQWRRGVFTLSISYRLNQEKKRQNTEGGGNSEEE